jgi:hypothetical protein
LRVLAWRRGSRASQRALREVPAAPGVGVVG